jgi:hypothetical protein
MAAEERLLDQHLRPMRGAGKRGWSGILDSVYYAGYYGHGHVLRAWPPGLAD